MFLLRYKMLRATSTLFVLTSAIVAGQRPSFAGPRPIGFPELVNRTTTPPPDGLGNRFGEDSTERLPIEANGDRDLIDRLSKLPIDKQPFWFINWQAYEAHRKNPQSYPQRPNGFLDPVPQNSGGSASSNSQGISNSNQEFINNQGVSNNNQGFSNQNQGSPNQNSGFPTQNLGLPTQNQGISPQNQGFSTQTQGFSNQDQGFSNTKPGLPSNNGIVKVSNGLSNPSSGFTNSINGIVLTDPHLMYSIPQNINSNTGRPNTGLSGQDSASTSSGLSPQQIFIIPQQGLSTTIHKFSNQGIPSQGIPTSNKGGSNTSTGFSSNIVLSNTNPNINSRFAASTSALSSSSSNKVGDANNYTYNWNKSFSNSYNYSYNYTTHFRVPQEPRPVNNNQERFRYI